RWCWLGRYGSVIRRPGSGDLLVGVLRRPKKGCGVERGVDTPFNNTFFSDLVNNQSNRNRRADDRYCLSGSDGNTRGARPKNPAQNSCHYCLIFPPILSGSSDQIVRADAILSQNADNTAFRQGFCKVIIASFFLTITRPVL